MSDNETLYGYDAAPDEEVLSAAEAILQENSAAFEELAK